MNVDTINRHLAQGQIKDQGVFPHLDELKNIAYVFKPEFGLEKLPQEPGLISIRGARQFGKSTWLEHELKNTIQEFGPGSAYYLNGDEIHDFEHLTQSIRAIMPLFNPEAKVQRLFIDEITAVAQWEKSLKRLLDAGELKTVLVVTTGSKASDLRRGIERLPGRKGKLSRNSYIFLPISYAEFKRVCGPTLQENTLISYVLSGGSPIAANELATHGTIREYVITMVKDWILGEFASTGRSRISLLKLLELIHRYGGTPVGYSKLAREADLANNTVALGYIEHLSDLLCLVPSYSWDLSRKLGLLRKPCKFHFVNLLFALASSPLKMRSVNDFKCLDNTQKGIWWEWLIAQELWRRNALKDPDHCFSLYFWKNDVNEIDFVTQPESRLIETKSGKASLLDFPWFQKSFPHQEKLTVVHNGQRALSQYINIITFEDFLLSKEN